MNIVLEGLLYLCGGLLRCLDLLTDVWYVSTQRFDDDWLQLLSIALLLTPSVIFFVVFLYVGVSHCCRGRAASGSVHLLLGLAVSVAEPIGLIMCIFGVMLAMKKSKLSDYYIVEGVTRSAALVEGIFESLPQLIIQSYNNFENDLWDPFTTVSVVLSGAGFLYSCLKLLHAMDKMRHIDQVHLQKQATKRAIKQASSWQVSPSQPQAESEEGPAEVYAPDCESPL